MLRKQLSELISREVKDPRLAEIVSITQVRVSPDLRSARVSVSILGTNEEKEETLAGLGAAAAFLRRLLKERITLRYVPFMTFHRDDSIEEAIRLSVLLREEAPTERIEETTGDEQ
jgi:ribosome-binding factor A